jgi:hypothetical protein
MNVIIKRDHKMSMKILIMMNYGIKIDIQSKLLILQSHKSNF